MEAKNKALNHFDKDGKAIMVDVGNKPISESEATASCYIQMLPETLSMIELGSSSKGDVLGVARVAGIQGAKKCPDLIPLCHPLSLNAVAINFVIDSDLNRVGIDLERFWKDVLFVLGRLVRFLLRHIQLQEPPRCLATPRGASQYAGVLTPRRMQDQCYL